MNAPVPWTVAEDAGPVADLDQHITGEYARYASWTAMFPNPQETDMQGYIADIENLTEDNHDFRRVLYTGHHMQLVLMALDPGQSIGVETHDTHDQFFRIEQGKGLALIDGVERKVSDGDCIIVPAGAKHDLTNTGKKSLQLYTLYSPPRHIAELIQATQAEAEASDEAFDGVATE